MTVLTGELPSTELGAQFKLSDLHLPEELPLSLPSKLVQQRPDVRAQEALLHAASAEIGVATARLFPDFTINANVGSIATRLGDLFVPGSAIWSFGGNLLQPVFHGGELIHKRRAAVAAYEQAAAQYRSTVLQAFQNVADTLSALEFDAAELKTQDAAVQAAFDSLELDSTAVPNRCCQLSVSTKFRARLPTGAYWPNKCTSQTLCRHCRIVSGTGRRMVEPYRFICHLIGGAKKE